MYARWWCRHCRRRFRRVCSLVGVDPPHIIARRGDDDAVTPTTLSTRPGRQLGSGLKSLVFRAYTASASAVAVAGAFLPLPYAFTFSQSCCLKPPLSLFLFLPPSHAIHTHLVRFLFLSVLEGRGCA